MKNRLSTRQEIEQYILKRILEDKKLIEKITKNPTETVKQLISELDSINPALKEWLQTVNYKVYKEHEKEVILVLPYLLTNQKKLNEDEIRQVPPAAGNCCY